MAAAVVALCESAKVARTEGAKAWADDATYKTVQKALENFKLENEDENIGIGIVKRALEEPLRQIVGNAGQEGAVVVDKVRSNKSANYGFNAETEEYGDMIAMGVVDPTKVTRYALQNAASIAGLLLTTEALISEVPEQEREAPQMPGGGGGMGGF